MTERITLADMKNAGLCVPGLKKFVEASGLEVRDFVQHGIAVEDALKIDGWAALVDHVLTVKGKISGQEKQ